MPQMPLNFSIQIDAICPTCAYNTRYFSPNSVLVNTPSVQFLVIDCGVAQLLHAEYERYKLHVALPNRVASGLRPNPNRDSPITTCTDRSNADDNSSLSQPLRRPQMTSEIDHKHRSNSLRTRDNS